MFYDKIIYGTVYIDEDSFMRRKELTDYPFNVDEFKKVIVKARGERSQAQFCADCDLSYAYMNKYANGKMTDAPTIQTLKKIALATTLVSYEELLSAAGYDPAKYKNDRPVGAARKDLIYPVILGMANSPYDWKIESKGYQDGEPFEILVEKQEVKNWFFVPVTKKDISKEEIQNILLSHSAFSSGSKVSFVTDDEDIFLVLKGLEFPLLSIYMSVIKVNGNSVMEEVGIKTSLETELSVNHRDLIRPFSVD